MFGDFDSMTDKQKQILVSKNLNEPKSQNKVAIDLGSGSGFQSIALRSLGYIVHAVDFSRELLDELQQRDSSVIIREGDLLDLTFVEELHLSPELIVCMGDTLTHLGSKDDVILLLETVFRLLSPQQGSFLITYRDLSGARNDLDRFIPVKSDDTRILTCFLEEDEENNDKVKVFDLLYEKHAISHQWELKKSCYKKLKLSVCWLQQEMQRLGYVVEIISRLPSGMEVVIGKCI